MSVLVEGKNPGEFIASRGNGTISLDNIVLAQGQKYYPGDVLGQVTASQKYVAFNPAAADGSQNAAAINWNYTDATSADAKGIGVTREVEFNAGEVNWGAATAPQIQAGIQQLAAKGVVARTAV